MKAGSPVSSPAGSGPVTGPLRLQVPAVGGSRRAPIFTELLSQAAGAYLH